MVSRDALVAQARRYIGVRFAHQGREEDGLDCLGLLLITAGSLGLCFEGASIHEIDVPNYGLRPDIILLKQKLDRFLRPIPKQKFLPGDVALLKVNGSPQHLAIISDYPMQGELGMIHAYAPARKVVEHRYDPHWRRATYMAYRVPVVC